MYTIIKSKELKQLKQELTDLRIDNAVLRNTIMMLEAQLKPPVIEKPTIQPSNEEPDRIKRMREILGTEGTPWQRYKRSAEAHAREADHTTQGVIHPNVQ
jgi:hypothetical protein